MDQVLKNKIKTSCLQHLKTKGYPNLTSDQIMVEFPSLWVKLQSEGLISNLIRKGFTIEHFVAIALKKKQECDMLAKIQADKAKFAEFIRRSRGY